MAYADYVCTHDDKQCFLSVLCRCPYSLTIEECPDIVSALLNSPRLETEYLSIEQGASLTRLEYVQLGLLIQNSSSLTELALHLPFRDIPEEFCNSLAQSIRLTSLKLTVKYGILYAQNDALFSKIVSNQDGNGALERLLRDPRHQLKELSLKSTSLDDHQVMVLAHLLLHSRVEDIELDENHIQAPGFLEFCRLLSRMHTLRTVYFAGNPWLYRSSDETLEECGAALLRSLEANPFIQHVEGLENFPQSPLLFHYISLNGAGRQILTSSQSIPDGLWPLILARAGRKSGPSYISIHDEDTMKPMYNGEANAVFFFLQHCPKLFSFQKDNKQSFASLSAEISLPFDQMLQGRKRKGSSGGSSSGGCDRLQKIRSMATLNSTKSMGLDDDD